MLLYRKTETYLIREVIILNIYLLKFDKNISGKGLSNLLLKYFLQKNKLYNKKQ